MKIQTLAVIMILMAVMAQTMSTPQGPGRVGTGLSGGRRGSVSLTVPRGPFGRFRRSWRTHLEMKKRIMSRNFSGKQKIKN